MCGRGDKAFDLTGIESKTFFGHEIGACTERSVYQRRIVKGGSPVNAERRESSTGGRGRLEYVSEVARDE